MNYEKHYNALIEKARNTVHSGYTEIHHCTPRCLGGSNKKENLIEMTASQHFLAHQLLMKMYPDNLALAKAARMMTIDSNGQRVNNKLFAWIREKAAPHTEETKQKMRKPKSEAAKKNMSIGRANRNFREGTVHSEETKLKISAAAKGKKKDYDVWNKGKKTGPSWNSGKTLESLSLEHKEKVSHAMKASWARRKA